MQQGSKLPTGVQEPRVAIGANVPRPLSSVSPVVEPGLHLGGLERLGSLSLPCHCHDIIMYSLLGL